MNVSLIFLGKELREVRRNKFILPAYLLLPLIAVALPVLFTLLAPELVKAGTQQKDPVVLAILRMVQTVPEFAGRPLDEAVARYILRGVLGFYLLIPVALSSISAAFSIVSEKQQRTLEPILATPVTDREFLLGKLLASLLPAVAATWAAALAGATIIDLFSWQRYGALFLPDRFWTVGVFLLAPLLGAASVLATMRLSAKMTDPQTANQFAGLVIVPFFLVGIGVFGKILTLSFAALLIACLAVLLLAAFLFRVNVVKFQREEILTRWK